MCWLMFCFRFVGGYLFVLVLYGLRFGLSCFGVVFEFIVVYIGGVWFVLVFWDGFVILSFWCLVVMYGSGVSFVLIWSIILFVLMVGCDLAIVGGLYTGCLFWIVVNLFV